MISTLKSKLSKAEYERGVFKHQLEEALKSLAEFREAAAETVKVELSAPCECEALKTENEALKKEVHSLKTQVGKLKAAKKKTKAKKATTAKK